MNARTRQFIYDGLIYGSIIVVAIAALVRFGIVGQIKLPPIATHYTNATTFTTINHLAK